VKTGSRKQLLILGVLVIAGVVLAVMRWPATSVDDAGGSVRPGGTAQTPRPGNLVGDIRLESLEHRGETSASPTRDLFRFEARRAAGSPQPDSEPPRAIPRTPVNPAPVDTAPPAPALPAPPPPIPLRYIGYLEQPGQVPRVAVLSDGRGNVFNGKEGDIIEGRYRVLRIGTDSADLIYVDGRGRQTIRLSGQ
jgi:hypothetical protein